MNTMTDSMGRVVPTKYVGKYDRLRDRNARRIHDEATKIRKSLEAFVRNAIAGLDEVAKARETLGEKGNFSTTTFDGLIRVSIRQKYCIVLDERVVRARDMMVEYINGVLATAEGRRMEPIRLIVEEAFRANVSGYLPTAKIMSLLRLDIKDAKWKEASDLLKESLRPIAGKRYLAVEARKRVQDDFATIRLDISDCWPKEKEAENV